ncbi:MAG: hypothetical protein KDB03_28170 [Planctomycetales bacterium]|nr:hypothetical protein [Planctomycetales bacterium]
MNTSISRSVGLGGANLLLDVQTIQTLLNMIPTDQGGPQPLLDVDGLAGPKTNGSIFGFQRKHFGPAGADGRIDPDQRSLQKILDLLKHSIGPNPPNTSNFSGFTQEQIQILQKAVVDARTMVDNAMSLCSIAFAMLEPNKSITSLRHNFDVDVKSDNPISVAFQSTMLNMVQGNLATIRAGLSQEFPFLFEPKPGFPEAWVEGVTDPTVHIKPGFFDNSYNTDLSRAATILHERAHTVLRAPGHPGIGNGGGLVTLVVPPHEDKRPYYTNRARFFEDALRNPYNYEWLCVSLDSRYVENPGGNHLSSARMCCGATQMA